MTHSYCSEDFHLWVAHLIKSDTLPQQMKGEKGFSAFC